jgi:predicted ATPase
MNSWLVWLVVVTASVLLGFVGYHFTVRTLRFVTAALATAVVVLVTRYGVVHAAHAPTDLVNSFTRGFGDLSVAFFRPVLSAHRLPVPGRFGWLIICGVLIFAYRELEVWAMHCQPPTVDTSALKSEQIATQASGTPGEPSTDLQRHDELVRELKFRLPAVEVRAPAILPGGTRASGLASIVENSGFALSGLASAIVEFLGMLWPSPRRYQVHVWIEPEEKAAPGEKTASSCMRVTVDLEDRRTAQTIDTQTLTASAFEDAAEVVAGYVAWSIFKDDPTTPAWCYGAVDGEDIAALLLTREKRVVPSSWDDLHRVRKEQIETLETCRLHSGVSRYELAQLCDLEGDHVKALSLHAKNREQYPRFFRGRYRLAMSLEMVARRDFSDLGSHPIEVETFRDTLCILDSCGATAQPDGHPDHDFSAQSIFDRCQVTEESVNEDEIDVLRLTLLRVAQQELREIRKQLALWRVLWASLRHRDERAIWIKFLGLTERQRFHDGARVAELYITVRRCIAVREKTNGSNTGGIEDGEKSYDASTRRALRIVAAVAGEPVVITSLLQNSESWKTFDPARRRKAGEHASRTRWFPWQRRTPSWQAAYNTACLYGAAFEHCTKMGNAENIANLAVKSLKRAFTPQDSEMQRPSAWIDVDPAFAALKMWSKEFRRFLNDQKKMDYPQWRVTSQRTSFVGRYEELDHLHALLETTSLVTIVGPGGLGKTRLAAEVGLRAAAEYPGGVWPVHLAEVNDERLLPSTVASALGISDPAQRAIEESVVDHLSRAGTLLILDNCEHLVDSCADLVAQWLRACPELTVLATSRMALGLAEEHLLRLPSLSEPAAITLLAQRAVQARSEFSVTATNSGAVKKICRQLDGLPLALELAGARLASFSPGQVADRLADTLGALDLGPRASEACNRTLRAALDWSYQLLDAEERELIRTLAVFRGGFSTSAAEAVGARPRDVLSNLVTQSLVEVDHDIDDSRFRLLEPVRQYAWSLADVREREATQRRHAAWAVSLARHASTQLMFDEARWTELLELEHANIEAAIEWSLGRSGDESALRIVGYLGSIQGLEIT